MCVDEHYYYYCYWNYSLELYDGLIHYIVTGGNICDLQFGPYFKMSYLYQFSVIRGFLFSLSHTRWQGGSLFVSFNLLTTAVEEYY